MCSIKVDPGNSGVDPSKKSQKHENTAPNLESAPAVEELTLVGKVNNMKNAMLNLELIPAIVE